jgi:DNA mismatch repair protein MutS2
MSSQIFKDPDILNLLEWPLVSKELQSLAHFNHTVKDRIFTPKSEIDIINCFEKTQNLINFFHEESFLEPSKALTQLSSDGEFFTCVRRINKNAVLDLNELNQIALGIEFYTDHYFSLTEIGFTKEPKQDFHEIKRSYSNKFLKEFRSFVQKDGEVDYFKHPILRELYRSQLDLEQKIRKTLQQTMGESSWSSKLQFNSFDLINDRYVLPIRSDSYQSELGQIIARSDSGQTLFIEPAKIRNLNISRLELVLSLDKEINSLTLKFSNHLNVLRNHLKLILNVLIHFDEYRLRAQFAYKNNYSMPTLTEKKEMYIKDMFHPLIVNPVKNTINITESSRGIIISGPNTGGKTATLKTLGLVQLFIKFGLFIPASEAVIHLYENVFYFGNDGQNLPEGLSSFASEVKNYSELIEELGNTNLIIIDEIFNSTSSEEASALALALFDEINKMSSTHFIVSTHHQMLKTLMHDKESFISAHVGFNNETNKPSYILHTGTPGSSQALKVFTKLTENNERNTRIFNKAIKILDNKMLNYESLLEKISIKENELDQILSNNKEMNLQIANKKKSIDGVYQLKLEEKVIALENKIKRILDKANTHFYKAKTGKIESKRQFDKKSDEIKSLLHEIKPEVQKKEAGDKYAHMKKPKEIIVGNSYFSIFLGQTIVVKSLNSKKDVTVTKGLMTIKCPIDSLRIAHKVKGQQIQIKYAQNSNAKTEYDCRGMRLGEFESLVESAVADLLTDSIPFVNFIHGHGNGTLKDWVRKFVKTNKSIKIDTNESGNDGETRVILA